MGKIFIADSMNGSFTVVQIKQNIQEAQRAYVDTRRYSTPGSALQYKSTTATERFLLVFEQQQQQQQQQINQLN
jgi:hypothetical protein